MSEMNERIQQLLARVPEERRRAAAALLAEYGPRLFDLAQEDAWQYLRRLMAADIEAAAELDARLSSEEFIAKVKANTARWEAVARYDKVRADLQNELLLRIAPVVASILAALVGL